jgi:hypothetical protein
MNLLETLQQTRPQTTQAEITTLLSTYDKTEAEFLESETYITAALQELEVGLAKVKTKPNLAKKGNGAITESKVTLQTTPIDVQTLINAANINSDQALVNLANLPQEQFVEFVNATLAQTGQLLQGDLTDYVDTLSNQLRQDILSRVTATVNFTTDRNRQQLMMDQIALMS